MKAGSRSRGATRKEYNAYFREYRLKNLKRMRKYVREYNKIWRKKYGYHNEKKWTKKHRTEVNIHKLVRRAILAGKIKRKPCYFCGEKKVVAHHENYKKPLKVVFVCKVHHRQIHYGRRKKIK